MKNKLANFIVIALIVAAFVWFFEIRLLWSAGLQYRADTSFSKTPGKILSGDVEEVSGKTTHYRPTFTYTYQVNGQNFQGDRFRYDGHPQYSNREAAENMLAKHPRGSVITVYYDPNNPGDAVLSTRVDVSDIAMPLLFSPVIFVFLNALMKFGSELNWPGKDRTAGGVKMFTEMMTTRVRLPRYRPSSAGLMVAAILAFAGGIVVAAMGRNHPPLLLGGWSLAAILAGGGTAYLIQYQRVHSGAQDLVINEGSRTVELPLTYKRKERMRLAYSDIQSVVLEKVAHRGKSSVSYTYAPTLQPKDGTSQRLAEMSQERAESFAAWLREKLGIKADVPVLDEK